MRSPEFTKGQKFNWKSKKGHSRSFEVKKKAQWYLGAWKKNSQLFQTLIFFSIPRISRNFWSTISRGLTLRLSEGTCASLFVGVIVFQGNILQLTSSNYFACCQALIFDTWNPDSLGVKNGDFEVQKVEKFISRMKKWNETFLGSRLSFILWLELAHLWRLICVERFGKLQNSLINWGRPRPNFVAVRIICFYHTSH